MATEAAQSSSKETNDPRAARLAILAAARQIHRRDGAGAVSFANVAKEGSIPPETISAYFQNPQEIVLALAAEDLSSLARSMNGEEQKPAPAKTETKSENEKPQSMPAVKKKTVMPAQLEQVMKDVAPDNGKEVISGAMARLERRVQVMEKAFTDIVDRHEKSVRERGAAVQSVEESVSAILSRLDACEKHNAEVLNEMRAMFAQIADRVDRIESAKHERQSLSAPMPVSAPMPAAVSMDSAVAIPHAPLSPAPEIPAPVPMPEAVAAPGMAVLAKTDQPIDFGAMPSFEKLVPDPQHKLSEPAPVRAERKETYLSSARRAALAAAESESTAAPSLSEKRTNRGNRAKFLVLACLAPVAILGTAFVVLNRNTVTAEPVSVTQTIAPQQTAAGDAPGQAPTAEAANDAGPAQTQATLPATSPEVVAGVAEIAPPKGTSSTSIALLKTAAEAGDVKAMRDAGLKYLSGDGVEANEPEAARWLMRAAYKGEPVSEYWLATLYARGHGVPSDAFQANHWYEAAAKQGNRRAMHSLAVANFQGWGMEKNYEQAAKWFKQAAELGLVNSQFNLAVLYERGSGVPQSITEAYKWYAIAAAQGDTEAQSRIPILTSQMKPADLALAQSAVASFKAQPMNQAANLTAGSPQLPGG